MKYALNGKIYSTETSTKIAEIIFNECTATEEPVEVLRTPKGCYWYYRPSLMTVVTLKKEEFFDLYINHRGLLEDEEINEIEGLSKYIASLQDA